MNIPYEKINKGIKIFCVALAILLAIIFGIVGFYTLKGYGLYKNAIDEKSIDERIVEIKKKDNYTHIENVPDFYVDALISVEDHRFRYHNGIDIRSIGRAILTNIQKKKMAEGGSTITQQLAKNLLFSQDKKLERKFAELFAAKALEERYSKEEILELYINSIYYGEGYYSIHEAAQGFFNKNPEDLEDAECVVLVGLPNAPSIYSPKTNPELCKQRARQVTKALIEYKDLGLGYANVLECTADVAIDEIYKTKRLK